MVKKHHSYYFLFNDTGDNTYGSSVKKFGYSLAKPVIAVCCMLVYVCVCALVRVLAWVSACVCFGMEREGGGGNACKLAV